MSGEPRGLCLLTSRLGDYLLGVELEQVTAVEEPGSSPAACDLGERWVVPGLAGGERRLLVIATPRGPLRLLVGERAETWTIPASALQSVPSFLDGLGQLAAIRGIFLLESQIGFLLDLDRLLAAHDVAGGPR